LRRKREDIGDRKAFKTVETLATPRRKKIVQPFFLGLFRVPLFI
jgi:hypothetical protein